MKVVPIMNRMMHAVNIVIMRLHCLHEYMLRAASPLLANCTGTAQTHAKNTTASASSALSPDRPPPHLHRLILSSVTAHFLHPASAYASLMVHDNANP